MLTWWGDVTTRPIRGRFPDPRRSQRGALFVNKAWVGHAEMVTYHETGDNAGFTEFKRTTDLKEEPSRHTPNSVHPNMDVSNVENGEDGPGTDHYR